MFNEDQLPKNKNINLLERNAAKHPLLQLIYNKKKDEEIKKKNAYKKSIQSYKTLDLKFRKRAISSTNETNSNNLSPNNKHINKPRYKLTDFKNDDNNLYSSVYSNSESKDDIKNINDQLQNIKNIKKINLSKSTAFNKRKTMCYLPNTNLLFPNVSPNKKSFNLKKNSKDGNFNEHNKEIDLMHKSINFNNNSIFVSEPRQFRYSNAQKFLGDKVLCQKTVEFSLLTNKSNKNSSKNLSLKETNPNNLPIPNFKLFYENTNNKDILLTPEKKNQNNNTINQTNKNNNIINKFKTENNELKNNFNKRKSINFANKLILYKKDKNNLLNMNNSKDFEKRKSFISFLPKKNNYQNSKFRINSLGKESLCLSQTAKRKINIKKSSNRKKLKIKNEKKEIDNITTNRLLSPIKTDIQKFVKNMNINNDLEESSKLFFSKKDINRNPLRQFNKLIIKKNKLNKNIFFKDSAFTDNEHMESNDNILVLQNRTGYYDLNSIFSKKLINKDEEEYINKKRAKLFEEVEATNKESDVYNSYNEEIKNYFLKNYAVDKITERIFENFEPLENKIENKKEKIEKQEKELKEILLEIINKSHYYSMDKVFKLGFSILKQKKINKQVKIISHYILEMFDIYPNLIKQFEIKWNNKRRKEYYYKKMIQIFASRNEISNTKINKRNSLALDKDYFIYKERINNEINLNLTINTLHLKIKNLTEQKRDSKVSNSSRKRLSTLKHRNNLTSKYDSKNQILSLFAQNNVEKDQTKIIKKNTQEVSVDKKIGNFVKIQKELGFTQHNENFEKFAKLYRISQKNLVTVPNRKNSENEDKKNYTNFNSEKETLFNTAKTNLDNYNILKNRQIFRYSTSKQINLEKRFSQLFINHRNRIQLDKKNKIDNMTIKFAGIDQLTKEAALIKTQEIERDLPDAKLFDKFVSAIQRRKINQFDMLLQKKGDAFNRIVNKQEFNTRNTLLIYSTQYNLKSLVELLLLKGADPNIQNNFGNTALHIAFKNDNVFIINLLLEYKADQKIKNDNGLLPWQMSNSLNN